MYIHTRLRVFTVNLADSSIDSSRTEMRETQDVDLLYACSVQEGGIVHRVIRWESSASRVDRRAFYYSLYLCIAAYRIWLLIIHTRAYTAI